MSGHASRKERLVAILLITNTRSGPKLVFNYPPVPQVPSSGAGGNDLGSQDEAPHDWDERHTVDYLKRGIYGENDSSRSVDQRGPTVVNDFDHNGKVLGVSIDSLEKLLSPGRWCDRQKFEVSLDKVIFVSHPVYSDREGRWTKKHKSATETERDRPMTPKASNEEAEGVDGHNDRTDPGITITEATPAKLKHDFSHVPESFDSNRGLSLGTSENSGSSMSAFSQVPLTAFHVVFAMSNSSPSQNSYVSEVYEHLARKLSRALTYCQKRSNYVGAESRSLSQSMAKAKHDGTSGAQLCQRLREGSELARALGVIYDQISIGEVAEFRLDGAEMSLKLHSKDQEDNGDMMLDRHSAILLLEDREVLLRKISHPDASPLAHFIREHTPTKTLQKQTLKLGMSIYNVVYLAQHLIQWRKARTIAPLHPRNTYIVGRHAPLHELESHTMHYARRFAGLPSLPRMLKVLSGRPVKYGLLIPSRDHRGPYMDMLAYLVRHQFVERLETSGWLQAPATSLPSKGKVDVEPNKNRRPLSVASLLSPQLRPLVDDDTASISSERTAIPVSILDTLRRPDSPATTASSDKNLRDDKIVRMVKDPVSPTDDDLLRLSHITEAIDDHDLRGRLPSLYPYFDGEAALEDIAAREGLKRSTLDTWLDTLQDAGFLLTFRHV